VPEIIVKTVEIDEIAIDDRAWSAHATVKVMFAFSDQGSVLHRCRVHVNAKFARSVSKARYMLRSRNLAVQKVNDYFDGKDVVHKNVFVN
jgi:hypothetical protein